METLEDVRLELARWGRWWRYQEAKGLSHASTGPGQKLIELAKLGCRIQQNVKHDRSENIRVPRWIAEVDAVVAELPQGQRAALATYYVRSRHIPRRRVKSRALLLAEMRVLRSL